jgi:hypothetical protein
MARRINRFGPYRVDEVRSAAATSRVGEGGADGSHRSTIKLEVSAVLRQVLLGHAETLTIFLPS